MNSAMFPGPNAGLAVPAQQISDPPAGDQGSISVVERYLRIGFRWKWWILGAVALALLVGIILTLLATPLYTAATRLEISREASRIVEVGEVEPVGRAADTEFYQTQYGLLESRAMAERVARDLRLADDPAFFAAFDRADLVDGSGGAGAVGRDERQGLAASILLANVSVSPIRLSSLVDVGWTSPDPALSARVANAWANAFIQYNLERRFEATAYARQFLEDRLGQVRRRLEESERQLVGYASNQALINIPAGEASEGGSAPERSLTADSLVALNAALSDATAERIRAESRLRQLGAGAVQEALQNSAITTMRGQRAQAAAEYERLLTQFEPGYPAAQALAAQIRELDQSIAREEARVQTSLRNEYRDSVERERALASRVEGLKQNFMDQRRRSIQYNIYQRDVDTNRELYNGLLQRYKEIGVTGGVGNNNIAVVDTAQVPGAPSYPRPIVNILVSLLAGLVIGVGLAFIREQLDESITDPSDLERRIGLPMLGAIPKTTIEEPRSELRDPKSGLTEAYLSVQSSLAFSSDHGIPKSLMVTSTRASEGKSTTAYAIAYSIARGGARTILIDADMRSPSVHHDLGLGNDCGLSNYLSGTDNVDSLIQHKDDEPMAILTAGPQPPNAAELLRGQRLEALLAELSAKFDHIIIDSPPVMGLADAPTIASRTEGTVFVIEARSIKVRIAKRAIDRLRQGQARLLGTVLTKFSASSAHFGYGYDYGYGYGYGTRYGEATGR